jgi:hypothetical protein
MEALGGFRDAGFLNEAGSMGWTGQNSGSRFHQECGRETLQAWPDYKTLETENIVMRDTGGEGVDLMFTARKTNEA